MSFSLIKNNRIGYWFPILLSLFIYDDNQYLNIIFGNIILALGLILWSNLFIKFKIKIIFEFIGVVIFNFIMFFQMAHFHLFNDNIKPSTFFIIFDTNSNETIDFLSMYIDSTIIFLIISLSLITVLGLILYIKYPIKKPNLKFNFLFLIIILVLFSSYKTRKNLFPNIIYKAVKDYNYEKNRLKEITYDKYGGDFSEVQHKEDSSEEIYVVIIGESTTKTHMQLYDYYRKTNPLLNKIKDELIVYNDVISPNTHTIPSLEKSLTLGTTDSPDKKFNGTIIQLFNKAGFKTYWISNQKPMGFNESMTTIISKNCDEQYFVNTSGYGHQSLDEKVLSPFKKVLKQEYRKKLIVIHIMGTHVIYSNRYPPSFKKFNGTPDTKFNHDEAHAVINDYDNAVLYNDFIINEIINEVRSTESKSYVVYFSDHGEDVFETMDMAGHNEINGSKPMYEIPFIIWRSDKFKQYNRKFVFDTNRKSTTEDLLFTLSDLSNITFKEFESSKSLVNENFVEKKRLISNQLDYDTFFNSKNE